MPSASSIWRTRRWSEPDATNDSKHAHKVQEGVRRMGQAIEPSGSGLLEQDLRD